MSTINLSVRIISDIFWKKIFNEDELVSSSIKTKLFDDLISLEKLLESYNFFRSHSLIEALVPLSLFKFTNQ